MPDDWGHCLFVGSVIGADYEVRHCWVNSLLDSPARFLGSGHRMLLHDLETAKKLGTTCWWAGFVAAIHIDIDNMPKEVKTQLKSLVRPIQRGRSANASQQHRMTQPARNPRIDNEQLTTYLRTIFLRVHERVGINVWLDSETGRETFIFIEPNTMLPTSLDYVNQFPLRGWYVNELPYNELPPDEPRIIPHPNLAQEDLRALPHTGDCLDMDVLRHLFRQ